MFSMINRGRLDEATQQEFDHLFGRLRGFLSQSFDEDGNLIVADPNYAIVPVGGIVQFAGTVAPGGYLLCDGAQVSRTTYKPLFDVIGTTYGAGDGSTTFALPDLRQRFPLGLAASGTGSALGQTGGAIDHVHTVNGSTDTRGAHSHTVDAHHHSHHHTHRVSGRTGDDLTGFTGGSSSQTVPVSLNPHQHDFDVTSADVDSATTTDVAPGTDTQGNHAHTWGATSSVSNPPFVVVNFLVYTGVVDAAAARRRHAA